MRCGHPDGHQDARERRRFGLFQIHASPQIMKPPQCGDSVQIEIERGKAASPHSSFHLALLNQNHNTHLPTRAPTHSLIQCPLRCPLSRTYQQQPAQTPIHRSNSILIIKWSFRYHPFIHPLHTTHQTVTSQYTDTSTTQHPRYLPTLLYLPYLPCF